MGEAGLKRGVVERVRAMALVEAGPRGAFLFLRPSDVFPHFPSCLQSPSFVLHQMTDLGGWEMRGS